MYCMGIKERREREREQRRNDIVDAAEQVFFTRGLANATMDEVAEVAELSKGTLYLYFKNKEDLYFAIVARANAILNEMFESVYRSQGNGFEKIRGIGEAYCEFAEKHSKYFNAMLYFESTEFGDEFESSPFAEACFAQSHRIFDIVINVLKLGIADGTIRPDIDPNMVATILWAQSTGVLQIAQNRGDHLKTYHAVDPKEMIRFSIDFIGVALEAKKH